MQAYNPLRCSTLKSCTRRSTENRLLAAAGSKTLIRLQRKRRERVQAYSTSGFWVAGRRVSPRITTRLHRIWLWLWHNPHPRLDILERQQPATGVIGKTSAAVYRHARAVSSLQSRRIAAQSKTRLFLASAPGASPVIIVRSSVRPRDTTLGTGDVRQRR